VLKSFSLGERRELLCRAKATQVTDQCLRPGLP
jgi:hypothetical protein